MTLFCSHGLLCLTYESSVGFKRLPESKNIVLAWSCKGQYCSQVVAQGQHCFHVSFMDGHIKKPLGITSNCMLLKDSYKYK